MTAPTLEAGPQAVATTSRRRSGLLLLVFVLAGAGVVLLQIRANRELSPIDELQHIDYMVKIAHGQLPRGGDRVGVVAMREEACRGLDVDPKLFFLLYGQVKALPSCRAATLDPAQFQEQGYNTAYPYPPTYYVITGLAARGLRVLPGVHSIVTAGRMAGAAWFALSIVLLWGLLGEFEAPEDVRVLVMLLYIATPALIQSAITVNPDAASLAAGAGMLLAAVRWERGKSPLWLLGLTTFLIMTLRPTNVVAVGLAGAYLVVRWSQGEHAWRENLRTKRGNFLPALVLVVVAGVVPSVGWVKVQDSRARIAVTAIPQTQRLHVSSFPASEALQQAFDAVTPVQMQLPPASLRRAATFFTTGGINIILTAGVVGSIAFAAADRRFIALGTGTLVAMVGAVPVLTAMLYFFSGIDGGIVPRYVISAAPAAYAAVPVLMAKRSLRVTTAVFAVLSFAFLVRAALP